jgi:nucleoside-diphosphate-sugar epimerase
MSGELVPVKGGSGFIGAHRILRLLDAGYRVRTTVRSLEREAGTRSMLKAGGAEPGKARRARTRKPSSRRPRAWLGWGRCGIRE